jgi:alkylation response protein AidB-like acyl-CoA dehydrogenase
MRTGRCAAHRALWPGHGGARHHGLWQPEQQQRFLPGIASGEVWWSQGYSEPGSGSDLASLKTRAERKGDKYIVNGQKTWTTLGQYGDWMFNLVRTSTEGKPQRASASC